ncbi:MAG: putative Histidine kinase [Promethearchaeota archaeon]|nr:MAG: putative Histidine kinase [Candidatus Lokiarchaeota archaeon]
MNKSIDQYLTEIDIIELKNVLNDPAQSVEKIIFIIEEKILEKITPLQKQLNQFQFIFENAHDFISVISDRFIFEYVNEKPHLTGFGYRSAEMVGASALEYIHPDDKDNIREILKKGFKEGDATSIFRFRHKNGSWVWIEALGKTFLDNSGKLKGIVISRDISKRKQIEETQKAIQKKLAQSEAKFRHLFNSLPYTVGLIDLEGTLIEINESGNDLMSIHSIDDIIGKSYKEIWKINSKNEELIEKYKIVLEKVKRTEDPIEIEFPIYQSDGGKIWVRSHTSLLNLNGNSFIQFLLQDITEQKLAKQKLKESEEKYREIFEGSRDGFVMVDLDGRIIDANQAYCNMLGYSLDELKDLENFYKITPKKYWEWEQREIWNNRLLRNGYSEIYEKEYIKKDGTLFPVELQSYAVFDQNKTPLYLWGVARDISKRRKAEQKLITSERKYRELTELLPDIIFEADTEGNLIYSNTKGFKEFRYTEKDIEHGLNITQLVAEDFKEKAEKSIEELLQGNEIEPSEYLMVRKDGSTFYSRVNSRPLYREGKIIGLTGTVSNIHKQVIAKNKIKESQKKLKKLNLLKSELLRRTSHEFKTPLVSIKGFLDLLSESHENELSQKALKYIQEIRLGCERQEKLITDILDAAELESEKIELNKTSENVTELIHSVLNSLKGALDSKNHSLELELHKNIKILIEREKILQVLNNILLNAIRNTQKGGKIIIKSKETEKYYLISIQDTGLGFTEEERCIAFTQFGKIKRDEERGNNNDEKGTGLGLYISKKIIELHGGKIWLKSEGRNKGSTFYFTLPK